MDIHTRFYMTIGMYAGLAIVAGATLDGKIRLAVWLFLAGLALRTIIALRRYENKDRDQ